ncbi:MAG: 50S ribosomal protein L6 [Nitrospirales bacterium]|nr:50S ribosomal protein L6 [Nitrospira sp.]MEB2338782.1 50S ribosomal protein L6 [Nitrospirales bacterium]QOJ34297.1 MAG: 50S ribosomal protein L6 [Nitrospira sp.]
MSRIGKKPIAVPSGVDVKVAGPLVSVKGPMGKLDWRLAEGLSVQVKDGQLVVDRNGDARQTRALHGLVRAELSNMIYGVTKGYEKSLEITGVGYKAQMQGREMSFNVGYINPVIYAVPVGIDVKVDKQTLISIKGIDKRLVGQVAANIRAIKPPDVYKQKGIRYAGEALRKKEGKTGK